jgi:hypothetical protein
MFPKYTKRLEALEIVFDCVEIATLYLPKLTIGDTMKYQKVNERAIKMIPIRKITAGLIGFLFGLAKLAHHLQILT